MPLPILAETFFKGLPILSIVFSILKIVPWLVIIYLLKIYFSGARNTSERLMHSKIIMITGGTSGIGSAVARSLAERGAQIILLTHHAPSDPFLVDHIEDLRIATKNELIYAEQVDLASLHSIRLFATKWIDNVPPRRLDMIILCANTMKPRFGIKATTHDGLEGIWGINYLANFHLLSILSPALRIQPPDRDVRIIITTCSSYISGRIKGLKDTKAPLPEKQKYGTSKLALMMFAQAFQKHLDSYQRPDKQINNARVILVDPGFSRTPGMRRWLSMGSLWGLLGYVLLWPLWWLVLKPADRGAQTLLMAAMDADLGRGTGGRFLKECKEVDFLRDEVRDEAAAGKLWAFSEKQIIALEKEGALRRALARKEKETQEKEASSQKDGLVKAVPANSEKIKMPVARRSRKNG